MVIIIAFLLPKNCGPGPGPGGNNRKDIKPPKPPISQKKAQTIIEVKGESVYFNDKKIKESEIEQYVKRIPEKNKILFFIDKNTSNARMVEKITNILSNNKKHVFPEYKE